MRSPIAIAALVASVSVSAEHYLVIDLRSMDYFWMEFSGSQEKRVGRVKFNQTADDKYAARRYVGAGIFDGYMSVKTFTVKRRDDESILMKGSIQKEQTTRKSTLGPHYSSTYETTVIRGAFYDSQGNEDGEFIATQDYSGADLHYVCGSGHYRCVDWRTLYRGSQECRGKRFPGKFSHLNKKSCEDELKSWQVDEKARQVEEKARQVEEKAREEARICAPENKSASSFSVKQMYGCIEPVSFKTTQTEKLLYDKCLVSWIKASRITTFDRGSYDSMFSVFKDRTEYEFLSTVRDTTLNLYFNDDVPEDLKYLVNEAAYSCVVDPFSAPPEGFWPTPWAKPSWEAEEE